MPPIVSVRSFRPFLYSIQMLTNRTLKLFWLIRSSNKISEIEILNQKNEEKIKNFLLILFLIISKDITYCKYSLVVKICNWTMSFCRKIQKFTNETFEHNFMNDKMENMNMFKSLNLEVFALSTSFFLKIWFFSEICRT